MASDDQLSGKSAVALALARGLTSDEAAAHVGDVSGRTIRRWLADEPEFADEVRRYRAELLTRVLGQLTDSATEAVQTLRDSLTCDSPQTRVRAALGILSTLLHVRDAHDVEERLRILEAAATEAKEAP